MRSRIHPPCPFELLFAFFLLAGIAAQAAQGPSMIQTRPGASAQERLAALEVQRYAYLRTGKVLPIRSKGSGNRIVVARIQGSMSNLVNMLTPQEFTIRTVEANGRLTWWIVGGDDMGALYGAYRFAEHLGMRLDIDGDAVPDQRLKAWPIVNEVGRPRFSLRGLQPFHDFSTGPDWWNAQDYQAVLSQMAKLRFNFIGFHTYPSWNPAAGPEANVWIGLPEDVDANGDVRFGYEAGVVTTRRGWAVSPFPTSRYASGAGLLFEGDDFGPDFMLDCLEWPKTPEAATAMFNRHGEFQKEVFTHARRLGVKTCVGTELSLGVPKELAERLKSKGMNPEDPEVVRKLYEGTFLRLSRKVPLDYYWLWTPEIWLSMEPGCKDWEMTSRERVAQDLDIAATAVTNTKPPFKFATSGWRLGTREDALWMHKRAPGDWAASSINTSLGRDPVESAYGQIKDRPRWAIAWAEDDDTAGAHCCTTWDLQLWAARLLVDSDQAAQFGCEGMMAIHWRTAAIAPNIAALSRAGWTYHSPEGDSAIPETQKAPAPEQFWTDWGRSMFGLAGGTEAGRLVQKLDGSHLQINAFVGGGAATTDAQIHAAFQPLRELEALRSRIQGPANLERFDYWLNLIRATELRVRTWVLSARLNAKMSEAGNVQDATAKQTFIREQALPLRIVMARVYEDLIHRLVECAKSPGELGTISSIESGSRQRIIAGQDAAISAGLGEPLPKEAEIATEFRGAPRLFMSAAPTQLKAGEPSELRVFVLSQSKPADVNLFWRPIGSSKFKKEQAASKSRHAYRATLPAFKEGVIEYYMEAKVGDKQLRWPRTAPEICNTVVVW